MPFARLRTLLASYPHVAAWLVNILPKFHGEIIAWNLLRERNIGCCPPATLDSFLEEMDIFLANNQGDNLSPQQVFGTIRANGEYCLVGQTIVSGSLTPETCCFDTNAGHGNTPFPGLCCFIRASSFARHTRPSSGFMRQSKPLEYAKNAEARIFIPSGILSSTNGFCWVTRLAELDNVLEQFPEEERWAAATSYLGLDLYEAAVLVIYPSYFSPKRMAQPTWVDTGERFLFRVAPGPDGWNQTVNTETGDPSLPEAIHCPAWLTADFTYRVYEPAFGFSINVPTLVERVSFP